MKTLRHNIQGNTTLLALFVVGVISTGVYFIANKVITERKLSSQLRRDIHSNLALRSITDYIKYGLKKGWCFDEKLSPELPAKCVFNFENKYSSARLMMPSSYAKMLENLGSGEYSSSFPILKNKTASDLMLQSFSIKLDLANLNINKDHALHRILTNLHSGLIKGLNITVSRIDNVTLPVNGDEVYIQIQTEFTGRDGQVLKTGFDVTDDEGQTTIAGSQLMRETARFVSNPRELNSFSLILPGTLYIGRDTPPENGHGDLAIPVGSINDVGMVFNSPVFINENIYLNQNSNYTPVTFNDVVIIGNGIIKDNDGNPFKIGESLGNKRYWRDLNLFGGFTKGLDSDGKRDLGLSVLSGVSESTTLDNETITQCINIIRAQSDPDITSGTRLVAESINSNIASETAYSNELSDFTSRLSFSTIPSGALNPFVPQIIKQADAGISYDKGKFNNLSRPFNSSYVDLSTIQYTISPAYDLASGTKLVMWAMMEWNDSQLKIPILENQYGDGHTVTINFSPYNKNQMDTAETEKNTASATVTSKKADRDAAFETLNSRKAEKDALEASKPSSDSGLLDAWMNDLDKGLKLAKLNGGKSVDGSIAEAEVKLNKAEDKLNDAKDQLNKAEDKYIQFKKYYDNPGKLIISTTKPRNGFEKRQSVFRNMSLQIVNGEHFRKIRSNDNPMNLEPEGIKNFSIEAMDYSATDGGISERAKKPGGGNTNNPSENPAADINNVHFKFKFDGNPRKLVVSNINADFKENGIPFSIYKPLDFKINYEAKIFRCFDSAGGTNLDAFKPASFAAADFTETANDSWHFASPDPKTTFYDEEINENSKNFRIAATRKDCVISRNVELVTGFFVCKNLIISERRKPLQMIGTFIVTKNFTLHPSALQAGITWSSIHNQAATNLMKGSNSFGLKTLHKADGGSCSTLYDSKVPFWHPDPGLNILADRIRCSPTFLLQGMGPPRWTAVDPDCGRIGDSSNTQCLLRIRNYNLIQLERIYGQ